MWTGMWTSDLQGKKPSKTDSEKSQRRSNPASFHIKTNAEILKELIQRWKEQGYTFGSLKDLTVAKS